MGRRVGARPSVGSQGRLPRRGDIGMEKRRTTVNRPEGPKTVESSTDAGNDLRVGGTVRVHVAGLRWPKGKKAEEPDPHETPGEQPRASGRFQTGSHVVRLPFEKVLCLRANGQGTGGTLG